MIFREIAEWNGNYVKWTLFYTHCEEPVVENSTIVLFLTVDGNPIYNGCWVP